MTINSPSDSLIAALSQARITAANHQFIRHITNAAGIESYQFVDQAGKPYVIATRSNGLKDLHIYYGATNGFSSEEEVIRIAGSEMGRGESSTRKGTWYVLHPVNDARVGGERGRDVRRAAAFCECGMQLSLSGMCASCNVSEPHAATPAAGNDTYLSACRNRLKQAGTPADETIAVLTRMSQPLRTTTTERSS